MRLFFVHHERDGDSLDLFVIAVNAEQVSKIWRDYYGEEERPHFIYRIAAASVNGYHEKPYALEWHGANLPRVGGSATLG